jgi:hypothetical protein
VTWQTHLRQAELLRLARAQQYEFCRIRQHDNERSVRNPGWLVCRRCGSVTIPEPAEVRA